MRRTVKPDLASRSQQAEAVQVDGCGGAFEWMMVDNVGASHLQLHCSNMLTVWIPLQGSREQEGPTTRERTQIVAIHRQRWLGYLPLSDPSFGRIGGSRQVPTNALGRAFKAAARFESVGDLGPTHRHCGCRSSVWRPELAIAARINRQPTTPATVRCSPRNRTAIRTAATGSTRVATTAAPLGVLRRPV